MPCVSEVHVTGHKHSFKQSSVRFTLGELLRIFGSHCNPAPGSTSVGAT